MPTLSISELKATLSERIRHVKAGQTLVVTERGRPVARLVPYGSCDDEGELTLVELESAGLVRRGTGPLPARFWEMPRPTDETCSVLRAVLDEREEGW